MKKKLSNLIIIGFMMMIKDISADWMALKPKLKSKYTRTRSKLGLNYDDSQNIDDLIALLNKYAQQKPGERPLGINQFIFGFNALQETMKAFFEKIVLQTSDKEAFNTINEYITEINNIDKQANEIMGKIKSGTIKIHAKRFNLEELEKASTLFEEYKKLLLSDLEKIKNMIEEEKQLPLAQLAKALSDLTTALQ